MVLCQGRLWHHAAPLLWLHDWLRGALESLACPLGGGGWGDANALPAECLPHNERPKCHGEAQEVNMPAWQKAGQCIGHAARLEGRARQILTPDRLRSAQLDRPACSACRCRLPGVGPGNWRQHAACCCAWDLCLLVSTLMLLAQGALVWQLHASFWAVSHRFKFRRQLNMRGCSVPHLSVSVSVNNKIDPVA